MNHFFHFAIRSEYSITDSIIRIKPLVKQAAKDGQTSLGIADLSNMFAMVKFYKACISEGIKPVIGTEVLLEDESVILYAMNNDGYQNLLTLVSKSYTEGLTDGLPILSKQALFEQNSGIIAILTERSNIGAQLVGATPARAVDTLKLWQNVFGDRLYIGIKRTNRAGEDVFIKNAIVHAAPLNIALVCYNDVRFMHEDDFEAHEARVCIAQGYVLADERRPRIYSASQSFKTGAQMHELFADLPQVIENTNHIATRCNVTLTLGKNVLPRFDVPDGESETSFFKKLSLDGLHARLKKLYPVDKRGDDWSNIYDEYKKRLDFELDIITQMGFEGYFLIVMDFIRWAKENGVPVGPGRGSGAGSLVAYSLDITNLDPLAYDLLFERFLNPERVSMPDFDIDFCIEGRDKVIEYVANQYGRDAVSQIITFGTMAARAVVRDVARVLGKSLGLADRMSKLIPKTPGITLDEAKDEEQQLAELLENSEGFDYEDATEIWQMAKKLEGLTRNVGKHAGGVLIAPGRISDFSPVYCDGEGGRVSQYDKSDVEAVGLVKFDFLGLRNLTVIKDALQNINARRKAQNLSPWVLEDLPLDDKNVYEGVLQTGKTSAVFQLESSGMKKYLTQLKPSNIEDVIAMCALYRPGPLETGMVADYINRKHGKQVVEYNHEKLEPILNTTYGVIVYQEQVMQISQAMAGYTLGGADMLRRAMGKKDAAEMARQRSIFVDGAKNKNIDEQTSGGVFDLMETFAGYGFNKSHSAAYGVLAYQTAYLKHYYPAEFMAAVLSSEMHNTDAVVFLISDCKDNFNLQVLPPSVNKSQWHFVADDTKTIIYGLGAIKGVGEAAVESIVLARQKGKFCDLYDFCNRVDIKKVGKRTLEALIMSGCFDDLSKYQEDGKPNYQTRAALWRQLPQAMQAAEQNRSNTLNGAMDLFSEIDNGLSVAPPLDNVIWSAKKRLGSENATLGLYLTGHPMDEYRQELKKYTKIQKLTDISDTTFTKSTTFAALVVDVANFGNRVMISLDDGSARIDTSCYTDRYGDLKSVLKVGEVIVIKASVRENDDRLFVRIIDANTITDARAQSLKKISIKIASDDTVRMQKILTLLSCKSNRAQNALTLPIDLYVYDNFGLAKVGVTHKFFKLIPNDEHLHTLRNILPKEHLVIA